MRNSTFISIASKIFIPTTVVVLLMVLSCDSDEEEKCQLGSEGCGCAMSNKCFEGLTCLSEVCVESDDDDDDDDDNDYVENESMKGCANTCEDEEICVDGQCVLCLEYFCEEEAIECFEDNDCVELPYCLGDCNSDACIDSCIETYIDGAEYYMEMLECMEEHCLD